MTRDMVRLSQKRIRPSLPAVAYTCPSLSNRSRHVTLLFTFLSSPFGDSLSEDVSKKRRESSEEIAASSLVSAYEMESYLRAVESIL